MEWTYCELTSADDGSALAWYRYNGQHADAFVAGRWQPSHGFLDHFYKGDPMLDRLDSDPTIANAND
jgi:hypothetical protein